MKAEKKNLKTPTTPVATSVIELSEEALQKVTGGDGLRNPTVVNVQAMEYEAQKTAAQNLRA